MKSWVTMVAAIGLLSACQPNDGHVKTLKERLDEGEIVEFNEPGFRRPSCGRAPDWSDVRLSGHPERERIVLRTQESVINPGERACFRVGSVVSLEVFNKPMGAARVASMKMAKLRFLRKSHLSGKVFAADDVFFEYKDNVSRRMRGEDGYVTILDLEYINGSAPDQKAIEERDKEKSEGDGYEETAKDGECLARSCRNKEGGPQWTSLTIAPEIQAEVTSGAVRSWYQFGNNNRFIVGQEIDLKLDPRSKDVIAKAKVTRTKRLRMKALNSTHFVTRDEATYAKVRDLVNNANKGNNEWITITDFEIPGTITRPGPVPAPQAGACQSITVYAPEFKAEDKRLPYISSAPCWREGALVKVIVVRSETDMFETIGRVVTVSPVGIWVELIGSNSTTEGAR